MQKMSKTFAVQMKDQAFEGQDSISVMTFLIVIEPACGSSGIYKVASILLVRAFMTCPALTALNRRLPVSPSDARPYKTTIKTYAFVVTHL